MAGFDPANKNGFFLPRAYCEPPEELLSKVFPWLDEVLLNTPNETPHLATYSFLKFLEYCRKVIIQDAVELVDKFSELSLLWENPLFSCREFLSFKEISRNLMRDRPDPNAEQIRNVAPEIASRISEFSSLQSMQFRELQLSSNTANQTLAHISQQLQNLNNYYNRGQESSRQFNFQLNVDRAGATLRSDDINFIQNSNSESTNSHSIDRNDPSGTIPVAQDTESGINAVTVSQIARVAQYRVSHGLVTLRQLWTEWKSGINGGPAIEQLERDHKAKWRTDDANCRFFLKRYKIIKMIKQIAVDRRIEEDDVVDNIERKRVRLGKSIDWFTKNMNEVCYTGEN